MSGGELYTSALSGIGLWGPDAGGIDAYCDSGIGEVMWTRSLSFGWNGPTSWTLPHPAEVVARGAAASRSWGSASAGFGLVRTKAATPATSTRTTTIATRRLRLPAAILRWSSARSRLASSLRSALVGRCFDVWFAM